MKFTVHNPNGTIEACPGDYPTLQAFVNEKFGSAFEAFQERGGLVLGADPVGADPVVADPVVADPVVADPVVADPVVADPVVADPV